MTESGIVCREASVEQLKQIAVAEGIGALCGYSPKGRESQREALIRVAVIGGRVVAALEENHLVGFVTLHPPGPAERWGRWPLLPVLELGGIEVARGYRRHGIAHRLLAETFSDPIIETRIVYAVAYAWCWDLETTGCSKGEYRRTLVRLLATFGFREVWTDDPDVLIDPNNVMLVRVGARVSGQTRRAFERRLVEGSGRGMEEMLTMILQKR